METFSSVRIDSFVARMVRHLEDAFSEEIASHGIDKTELEPLVRRGVRDAETYGVVCEDDLELYIQCMALLGPQFDREPDLAWAGRILLQTDLTGSEKMDRINDHLLFGLDEAR